jgi:uncharacterized SAM-binding protein YcdF (DUF218 family)
MLPLSIRLGPARFLDPALLLLVVLGVALYLASRGEVSASSTPGGAPSWTRERRARWGRLGAWVAWAALWILSTPFASGTLTGWTETRGPDLGAALAGKDRQRVALVVLSGGMRTYDQSLPPRERLSASATQRVLTASRLWREQGFGLIILTGAPAVETEAMLDLMTAMGVPPGNVILEERALNTRQNAIYSAEILREKGVETVVLVTSATHLRRAVKDFAAAGVTVIPAAADIVGGGSTSIDSFLPSAHALWQTQVSLHEILGYVRG